ARGARGAHFQLRRDRGRSAQPRPAQRRRRAPYARSGVPRAHRAQLGTASTAISAEHQETRIDLPGAFVPLWRKISRPSREPIGELIMPGLVLRDDQDGLTTLTLNRPEKLNALNVEMFVELRGHIDQIGEQTDRVGLVIVRGAGKCFSAGNDLGGIAAGQRPPRVNYQSE